MQLVSVGWREVAMAAAGHLWPPPHCGSLMHHSMSWLGNPCACLSLILTFQNPQAKMQTEQNLKDDGTIMEAEGTHSFLALPGCGKYPISPDWGIPRRMIHNAKKMEKMIMWLAWSHISLHEYMCMYGAGSNLNTPKEELN